MVDEVDVYKSRMYLIKCYDGVVQKSGDLDDDSFTVYSRLLQYDSFECPRSQRCDARRRSITADTVVGGKGIDTPLWHMMSVPPVISSSTNHTKCK